MSDHSKAALVTGGCGFVGRHVTLHLLSEGREVWVVDDLSVGRRPEEWLPAGFEIERRRQSPWSVYQGPSRLVFLEGDCREFFEARVPEDGPSIPHFGDAFHFAAVVGGRAKIDGNPIAVAIDLALDASFYNWAVTQRPDRSLFASSSAAYPIDMQQQEGAVALKESDIEFDGRLGQPDMTYGWSKLTGEYLGRLAAAHYGLHVACIRPFSGFGEDQDESYPIPAIAARAARREDPFEVWGTGRQGRDFVHIDDCVDAMMLAIEKISDGSAVNIGSGKLTSFLDAINIFTDLAGYQATVKPLLDKPVGVHSRYADMSYARQLLDWEPRISIRDGFARVLAEAEKRARTS